MVVFWGGRESPRGNAHAFRYMMVALVVREFRGWRRTVEVAGSARLRQAEQPTPWVVPAWAGRQAGPGGKCGAVLRFHEDFSSVRAELVCRLRSVVGEVCAWCVCFSGLPCGISARSL